VNANTSQEEAQHDALASCFKDPRLARILTAIPQVLPFERRTKIFHSLLNVDKEKRQEDEVAFMHARARAMFHGDLDDNSITSGREQVTIRRDALYQDSKEKLSSLGKRLRRQLKVTFVNQLGAHEAGIDGGGVFREFLDDLIKDAFNPSNHHQNIPPLFVESPTQLLCVNLEARRSPEILQHYEFFGQIIGKAVYESVLVEAQFCLPFLNQLLGKHNTLDDLKNLDPDFHKHLVSLRSMKRDEIENLGLTFELGNMELIPNGSFMNVTKENVIRYIHLVAHRRLNQDTAYQTRAFLKGFRDLIPAPWVRLFSARELQKVIGGDDSIKGIDVDGLKAVMQYSGGYHPSQPIIHWFWEILADMSPSQQRKFLKFMTSCSRQPLLGFQSLIPLPCIQQIRISEMEFESFQVTTNNNCRLPTSSTCMNLLKLPNYPSKEILRSKLVYAIESGAGFELS
jgi:ubiquitin-protein ligase E3 C